MTGAAPAAGDPTKGRERADGPAGVRLSREARRRIAEAAEAAYPLEACGFLLGPGDVTVDAIVPAPNRADRPDRFFIDARDVWEAMRAARREDRELLGVYHSHPDGDARPSPTDVDDAWGEWLHVIVACRGGAAGELRAWRFRDGGFEPLEVEDVEEVEEDRP